jgi:hypothetical protein
MSIRIFLPPPAIAALAVLALTLSPVLAQQPPPEDPADPPPRADKAGKPAKKVAAKPAKTEAIPAIGAPAIRQKAAEEKPKVKRPFGELEGWSSASEAEKKVLPKPREESSTGYKKPPVGFDSGGNLGMGMSF